MMEGGRKEAFPRAARREPGGWGESGGHEHRGATDAREGRDKSRALCVPSGEKSQGHTQPTTAECSARWSAPWGSAGGAANTDGSRHTCESQTRVLGH
jgi:hypothetical protein